MLGNILKNILGPGQQGSASGPAPQEPAFGMPVAEPAPERSHTHHRDYAGKIVVSFMVDGQSDGLAAGIKATQQQFRRYGYDYQIVELKDEGWRAHIERLLQKPEEICCVLSSTGMANELSVHTDRGVRSLWAEAGIPFLSVFGDHPAYFFPRHRSLGHGFMSLYCFEEHMEAMRAWAAPLPVMAQMPQGPWDIIGKEEVDFSAKAGGKVMFFKNGNSPARLRAFWQTLPRPIQACLNEIAHGADLLRLGRDLMPLHVLVREYLANRGLHLDEKPWIELFLVAQLDDYARRLKSTLIAESLLDLPVQVFGNFWDHVDFTGKRAVHLPGLSYFDTRKLIGESLAVLDMSPNVQTAPHDRFLAAVGRYTLCLTNRQSYYEKNYAQADDMMFDFRAESIRERVAGVLARPAQAVELGEAIAAEARESLSGKAAVEKIVDYAHMARFALSPVPFPGQQNFVVWPR